MTIVEEVLEKVTNNLKERKIIYDCGGDKIKTHLIAPESGLKVEFIALPTVFRALFEGTFTGDSREEDQDSLERDIYHLLESNYRHYLPPLSIRRKRGVPTLANHRKIFKGLIEENNEPNIVTTQNLSRCLYSTYFFKSAQNTS